jgi:hypothetical protein
MFSGMLGLEIEIVQICKLFKIPKLLQRLNENVERRKVSKR